jgi:hypothetical protein
MLILRICYTHIRGTIRVFLFADRFWSGIIFYLVRQKKKCTFKLTLGPKKMAVVPSGLFLEAFNET